MEKRDSKGRFLKGIKYKHSFKKGQPQSNTGRTHFKKGMVPWIKGKKGIHNSPETEFKKGQYSPNAHRFKAGHIPVNKKHPEEKIIKLFNSNAQTRIVIITLIFVSILAISSAIYFSYSSKDQGYFGQLSLNNTNKTIKEKLIDRDYIDELRKKDTIREEKNGSYKSFNSTEKKILIENFENETELEIQLLTNYNTKVGQGEDILVAEILLIDWKDDKLFDALSFYDVAEGYSSKQKSYWMRYGTDYVQEKCINEREGDKELEKCWNVTKTNWTDFNSLKYFKTKNVKIGIFTNTMGERKVEWVITKNGFEILEFASYEIVGLSTYTDSTGDYSVDDVWTMKFTPDSNFLVVGSYIDNHVSIFNVTNKSEIVELSTYTDISGDYSVERIYALDVSSDGNYLAISSSVDDSVSIMNITDKTSITGLSHYNDISGDFSVEGIRDLQFTPDGNYLITSSNIDDYVSIMNVTNKSLIDPLVSYSDSSSDYSIDALRSLDVSDDGNYLATSSWTDDQISIMNITDKTTIAELSTYNDNSGEYSIESIYDLEFTPDANFLVITSSTDDYVSIMNITEKSSIIGLSSFTDIDADYSIESIYTVKVSPDGNSMATSSPVDDYISIMDISNKSIITQADSYGDSDGEYSVEEIQALEISPDGLYVATSSVDDYISIMQFKANEGTWICNTDQDFDNSSCWSNNIVPTSGSGVIFNYQGTGNCNITNNTMPQDLESFTVENGYTGTIYFQPLFAEGDWTGSDTGTQIWNVTNDINISGGTMKIYGDAYNGNNITDEGHGQEWRSLNGNITIGSGVTLDGIGLGFAKEVGPGAGFPSGFGGGGGHGGYGGNVRPLNYGYTYGSATEPTSLGSGGGDDSSEATDGTAGGSAIKLHSTDTVTIDGTISMNGEDFPTQEPGAGAGGSIWILSETFAGSGTLDADGGASYQGGGGGGRISLNWTTKTFSGIIRAEGGTEVNPSVRTSQPGTLVIPNNEELIVNYDIALPSGEWNFTKLYVTNNAILWVREDNSTTNGTGVIINAPNFTLDSGSSIMGDGTGFKNKQGPGAGDSTGARGSGAGHGGIGGADGESSPGGSTYGFEKTPTSLGSGGGDDTGESQYGGFGGGAIKINATNIRIDGDISMNGTNFYGQEAGGGAAGSVWLVASENLIMVGNINAVGGNGHPTLGGAGGGGRIALGAGNLNFTGAIYNNGGDSGAQDGSGGTVYINASIYINASGIIKTIGYDGGNITFNDTLITLSGNYNATGTNSDANITLDYTNCASDYSGATFDPDATDLSGCTGNTCTCPSINTNWEVNMEDYCNLTTTCNLGTGNLSWIGSFGYFNCSAQLNLINRDAPPSSTIFYHYSGCEIIRA